MSLNGFRGSSIPGKGERSVEETRRERGKRKLNREKVGWREQPHLNASNLLLRQEKNKPESGCKRHLIGRTMKELSGVLGASQGCLRGARLSLLKRPNKSMHLWKGKFLRGGRESAEGTSYKSEVKRPRLGDGVRRGGEICDPAAGAQLLRKGEKRLHMGQKGNQSSISGRTPRSWP